MPTAARRRTRAGAAGLALGLALLLVPSGPAAQEAGDGLTREQGDAILRELKSIRLLLERHDQRDAPPLRPAPATASVEVSIADRPARGDVGAPLALVEFTDYECPFCRRFLKSTYPELKAKYIDTGRLRHVVKDLPLRMHRHARKAAQAAHCAGEQELFWEMHDRLFENARRLAEANLAGHAREAGLDVDAFERCLASGRHLESIDADSEEARRIGVTGTPTFVLGRAQGDIVKGKRIRGAKAFQVFEREIEALLSGTGGS